MYLVVFKLRFVVVFTGILSSLAFQYPKDSVAQRPGLKVGCNPRKSHLIRADALELAPTHKCLRFTARYSDSLIVIWAVVNYLSICYLTLDSDPRMPYVSFLLTIVQRR